MDPCVPVGSFEFLALSPFLKVSSLRVRPGSVAFIGLIRIGISNNKSMMWENGDSRFRTGASIFNVQRLYPSVVAASQQLRTTTHARLPVLENSYVELGTD